MTVINGVGGVRAPSNGTRPARGPSGFRVAQAQTAATGPAAGVEEIGLAGMLALQELPDRDVADREARRRGQDLLAALAEMQQAMLGLGLGLGQGLGQGDPARLTRLTAHVPTAADPALRDVVAAIALRARIEAARHSRRFEDDSGKTIETS